MRMITSYTAPVLGAALKQLKTLVAKNERDGAATVIFCEDRLTLAAERAVCECVGGTFSTAVYTFSRFLAAERGKCENLLTSQGSAMVIRRLIEENRSRLTLFKRLSAATAAQDVYDTVALFYSSRVTPDDIAAVHSSDPVLEGKLRDVELLYRAYVRYLEQSGSVDRNRYLALLPEVITSSPKIRGARVIFLGFQAFTCSVAECAAACMEAAADVSGIFIGGGSDVYVNEAAASFAAAAKDFGGVNRRTLKSELCPEAELLRTGIFDPDVFHAASPLPTRAVTVFEAADENGEAEYIAAEIIRHVFEDKLRYREIAVMLPDLAACAAPVERMLSEYGIPYYLDRRYSLYEHPVSTFLLAYLSCAADGCTQSSVCAAVSSPLFALRDGRREGERRRDKDAFANYMLRLAAHRGGVKREPKEEVLKALNLEYAAVERVRAPFLRSLKRIPSKGDGQKFCGALRGILSDFSAEETLAAMAEDYAADYPSLAAFSGRAFEAVNSVIDEAERLTRGVELSVSEFSKILKSGLVAAELSLIPPKQDAVFVGDLLKCANTGSKVVFAAGLTGDVPASGEDTAVFTDRDISSLEQLNIRISPKISQVNNRTRETAGLNMCAFSHRLHLSYPVRRGGEEGGVSRMVDYARALFCSPSGAPLAPVTAAHYFSNISNLTYLCSRPAPALRRLAAQPSPAVRSAIYDMLCANGYGEQAKAVLGAKPAGGDISCGARLYGSSFSPTVLETYFSCPYKCFMMRGLKLAEREEGVMRPLDCGNFIHAVLQKVFSPSVNELSDSETLAARARAEAEKLLATPAYSALSADKRGEYAAQKLIEECVAVCSGAFEQLKNSSFKVEEVEKVCRLALDGGIGLYGRIDRVDSSGDMVRVIDYKTGTVDSSAPLYYMGLKLQLPLYLSAAAKGKRAVGAYYFPAGVAYETERDGVFRLSGYMDGSDDVVLSSDSNIREGGKSLYVNAKLGGKTEGSLPRGEFEDFIFYSSLVARRGAAEMAAGNVDPSPAPDACKYCSLSGSCGFAAESQGGERRRESITCSGIARIVRKERGDE